jgi:STE24 endopeptidase
VASASASSAGFTAEQIARAATASRRAHRRFVARQGLYAIACLLMWFSGTARSMATAPGEASDIVWNITATTIALGWLLCLPLTLAAAFDERRAGLTRSWGWVLGRSLGMGVVLVVSGAAWMSLVWQASVDGIASLGGTVVVIVVGLVIIPILVTAGAKQISDQVVAARLSSLIRRAGVRIGGVRVRRVSHRTIRENAFVIGSWPTRRLVVYDTVLREGPACVDATVAHELGHMKMHHSVRRLGLLLGLGAGVFLATVEITRRLPQAVLTRTVLVPLPPSLGATGISFGSATVPYRAPDPAFVPLLVLAWGALALALRPVFVSFVRRQEESADRFAVWLTRDPDGFVTLLRRLALTNLADLEPSRLARLFLSTHGSIPDRMNWVRQEPLPPLRVPDPPGTSPEPRAAIVRS